MNAALLFTCTMNGIQFDIEKDVFKQAATQFKVLNVKGGNGKKIKYANFFPAPFAIDRWFTKGNSLDFKVVLTSSLKDENCIYGSGRIEIKK